MKNLMRGTIYQLKRDNFFFGCYYQQIDPQYQRKVSGESCLL